MRGGRGRFEGGVRGGAVPKNNLTKLVVAKEDNGLSCAEGLARHPLFHYMTPCSLHLIRTRSTTTRDRNLQGAVSTGGSPLDFLLLLQVLCVI